jgi:CRP-like cAMP-binding protein
METDLLMKLLVHTRPFRAFPGDVLYTVGDIAEDLLFLKTGQIDISINIPLPTFRTISYVVQHPVGVVMESGFFGDYEMIKKTTYRANYHTNHHCNLLSLKHEVFLESMQQYLLYKQSIYNHHHHHHHRLHHYSSTSQASSSTSKASSGISVEHFDQPRFEYRAKTFEYAIKIIEKHVYDTLHRLRHLYQNDEYTLPAAILRRWKCYLSKNYHHLGTYDVMNEESHRLFNDAHYGF